MKKMVSMPEILVVEDDDDTREVLAYVLHVHGLETRSCSTGEEALALVCSHHFDALITDQVMPGMTGLELVRRARSVDPELRCVVLSGYSAPSDADVPWLQKPISIGALVEVLALPRPDCAGR